MDTLYGESVNPLAVLYLASLVRAPCDASFLGGHQWTLSKEVRECQHFVSNAVSNAEKYWQSAVYLGGH
jgi:hypothetical protein